jgi:hypothetical protein
LRIREQHELVSGGAHRRIERRCLSTGLIAANHPDVRRADEVVRNRVSALGIDADDHLELSDVMRGAQAVGDSCTNRLDIVSRREDDRDGRKRARDSASRPDSPFSSCREVPDERRINDPDEKNAAHTQQGESPKDRHRSIPSPPRLRPPNSDSTTSTSLPNGDIFNGRVRRARDVPAAVRHNGFGFARRNEPLLIAHSRLGSAALAER